MDGLFCGQIPSTVYAGGRGLYSRVQRFVKIKQFVMGSLRWLIVSNLAEFSKDLRGSFGWRDRVGFSLTFIHKSEDSAKASRGADFLTYEIVGARCLLFFYKFFTCTN